MTVELNFTHEASRRSWVESANEPTGDFPLQNLPYGVGLVPAAPGPRITSANPSALSTGCRSTEPT